MAVGSENRPLFGYCAEALLFSEYFVGARVQPDVKYSQDDNVISPPNTLPF